jgi:DNA polymerase
LWRTLEDAAFTAIDTPGEAIEVCAGRAALKMTRDRRWLGLRLPSGRWVRLHRPAIVMDDRNGLFAPRPTLSAMGLAHQWVRQTLWGGVLTAYLVSATARDLLVAAALRCEARGWPVVLQVHDELLVETVAGSVTAEMLAEEMSRSPAWAEGCPIKTETAVRDRYGKGD